MERIIIMARDEVGVLAEITGVLAAANINLATVNTQVSGGLGTVIISTDNADTDQALKILTDAGFTAVADDSLIIRLKDEAGALAKVAARFSQAGINIQSLHILDRKDGYATAALSTAPEDRATAEELVGRDAVV